MDDVAHSAAPAAPAEPRRRPGVAGRLLRDYGLSIVLLCLFVAAWVVQTIAGWVEFSATQQAHGASPVLLGPDGYAWTWLEATFENWQSEFLQLLTFVVLTSFLYHRGSHESKDGDERLEALLEQVDRRLARLEQASDRARTPVDRPAAARGTAPVAPDRTR